MELFNSLKTRLETYDKPFKHWTISEPLTESAIKEACNAEISNPIKDGLKYDGTRAVDGGDGSFRQGIKSGGKAKKYRCFITRENSKKFPEITGFLDELCSKNVHQYISELIKKDLSNAFVRIEVICDRTGFWLKPHWDIKEKLLSSIIFINPSNSESENLGTDFYDEKLKRVKTVPYRNNYGYFFTSGPNTWHGMEKKEIKNERRCIQVNYVSFPTDWKVKSV